MTTADDRIRERYPHVAPERSAFSSDEEYDAAFLRFCKGQAELTEGSFAALSHATVTTFHDGRFAYANAAAQALFGVTPSDLGSKMANDYLYDADGKPIGTYIGRRISAGEVIHSEAVYVLRPDGHRDLRMLSVVPVFAPGTQTLVRAIGYFMDPTADERELESLRVLNRELGASVEKLRKENAHFERLAYTDEMTGLPNARAFWREMRQAVEDQRIEGGSMAVFYFDPDSFRTHNETYGHRTVDNMIRAVATRLREVTSTHRGFVARVGGDEFVAFFRGPNETLYRMLGAAFAEALTFRFEVREKETRDKVHILITVSIGGAIHLNGEIPEPGEFETEAEEAMYDCKATGRGEAKGQRYVLRPIPTHSSLPPRP